VDAEVLVRNGVVVRGAGFGTSTSPVVGYFGLEDYDGDGLNNEQERALGMDIYKADTDGDGINDGLEVKYGLNPLVADASIDSDNDGWTNAQEVAQGTNPLVDERGMDLDGDGLTTEQELALGTDPNKADTDADGLLDGQEDANHNGVVDAGETHPLLRDTDGDGIADGQDVQPLVANQANPLDTTGMTEPLVLSGTHVYTSIYIAPSTVVRGSGEEPLVLISRGDVVIEGKIDVKGGQGENAVNNSLVMALGGLGVSGGGSGGFGGVYGDGNRGIGAGAGGGGRKYSTDNVGQPGGGGGYGTAGAVGNPYYSRSGYNGTGGVVYGSMYIEPFDGGSGGGGGSSANTQYVPGTSTMGSNGGGGGAGGGAVYIEALGTLRITATGVIDADGGVGGAGVTGSNNYGAGGGGGSGGAIYLKAQVVEQSGSVHAAGGVGGVSGNNNGSGGTGGVGRIRVDAEVLMRNGAVVDSTIFKQSTNPQVGYLGTP
jgi:hypothetical protein